MKKTYVCRAILDGVVHGIIFSALLDFILTPYVIDFSYSNYIQLTTSCAILVAVVFLLLLWNVESNKTVFRSLLISFLSSATVFAIGLVFPFNLFNIESGDNQSGLFILIVAGVFIFLSLIFKILSVLLLIIRNLSRRI